MSQKHTSFTKAVSVSLRAAVFTFTVSYKVNGASLMISNRDQAIDYSTQIIEIVIPDEYGFSGYSESWGGKHNFMAS